MNWYQVTRTIKETACIEAESKEDAIRKIGEDGASWDVEVVKETAKKARFQEPV